MKLEMKVDKVFFINGKTIFAGDLQATYTYTSSVECRLMLDGIEIGHVVIDGEVLSDGEHRDLWTHENVDIDQYTIETHDVRLVSV